MVSKDVEVVNAFAKYVRQNADKSLVEGFTREEIEDAIACRVFVLGKDLKL